jgi:hypothetical protein
VWGCGVVKQIKKSSLFPLSTYPTLRFISNCEDIQLLLLPLRTQTKMRYFDYLHVALGSTCGQIRLLRILPRRRRLNLVRQEEIHETVLSQPAIALGEVGPKFDLENRKLTACRSRSQLLSAH